MEILKTMLDNLFAHELSPENILGSLSHALGKQAFLASKSDSHLVRELSKAMETLTESIKLEAEKKGVEAPKMLIRIFVENVSDKKNEGAVIGKQPPCSLSEANNGDLKIL